MAIQTKENRRIDTEKNWIFESSWMADLFCAQNPLEQNRVWKLPDLLDSLFPVDSIADSARIEQISSTLPDSHKTDAELILNTIEALRESWILTPEDIEYCFSHLAQSPKNLRLKQSFYHYLDTPLHQDRAHQVIQAIETLKSGQNSLPNGIFVRSHQSSYLFEEFSKSVPESTLEQPWQLWPTQTMRPIWMQGTPEQLCENVAHTISKRKRRGEQGSVIAFHGSAGLYQYLSQCLAHYNLDFSNHTDRDPEPRLRHKVGDLLASLRKDQTLSLEKRLELNALLLRSLSPAEPIDTLQESLSALIRVGHITEEQSQYLQSLPLDSSPSGTNGNDVDIIPFCPFVPSPTATLYAVADESLALPAPSQLLFTEVELDQLYQAGFSVPRISHHWEHVAKIIEQMHIGKHRPIFFAPKNITSDPTIKLGDRVMSPSKKQPPAQALDARQSEQPLKRLSATQLELYNQCPAHYYYRYRTPLKPISSQESQLALWLGIVTHNTLEDFFQNHEDIELDDLNTCFEKHLALLETEVGELGYLGSLIRAQWKQFAQSIDETEAALQEYLGPLRRAHFEVPFELKIDDIQITGKIDRIDVRPDESVLILDYKTGKVDFSPNQVVSGNHFQALIYLLAAEKISSAPKIGFLFYDLRKSELRRGMLSADSVDKAHKSNFTRGHVMEADKLASVKEKGIEHIKAIAQKIRENKFEATPSATVCGYCDFKGLCREAHGYD